MQTVDIDVAGDELERVAKEEVVGGQLVAVGRHGEEIRQPGEEG